MKLWLMECLGRDNHFFIVRAETPHDALLLAPKVIDKITELSPDGSATTLWEVCIEAPDNFD